MESTTKLAKRQGAIAWMAKNHIAANLLMMILLVGGIWTTFTIQKEVFPEFQLDIVRVSVVYPGSAPSEVETGILMPIEESIKGLEGIHEIISVAREGSGRVEIELIAGIDRMKVFQDIDQAIARIRTFPDEIDQPEVSLQQRRRDVMSVVLYGDVDIWTLRKLTEQLRDTLLNSPSINQVELSRVPDYVTHVEIPAQTLREYGLTLPQVAGIIRQASEDVPAGAVRTSDGEILLRLKERKEWAREFGEIEVVASDAGATLTLEDIATIRDGFEEDNFHSRFNMQPAVELDIYRTGNQSPLDIEKDVLKIMEDYADTLPPGVSWRVGSSNAEEFRQRLDLLINNGFLSILIVLAILSLFLDLRLAFWVMVGMTVSFIGGILFLPAVGVSINMISMFGFLIVLGIVVDDAIVVGENVFEERKTTADPVLASIDGTRIIANPVVFSILTNIIAFIPLMLIPGETGKFWGPLPVVVIIVLMISLVEALYILPAHLGHVRNKPSKLPIISLITKGQRSFAVLVEKFINTQYRWILDISLRYRYVTLASAIALFVIVGGYATSAHMGTVLMPQVAAHEIEAGIRLPVGTTPAQAEAMALELTQATMEMYEKHNLQETAEGVKSNVRRGNFIDIEIVMKPPDQRTMTGDEVIQLWRDQLGDIQGVDQITFEAESGPGGARQDISVDLSHTNIEILEKASQRLMAELELYESTRDISDNYNSGKKRMDFRLLPEGRVLGLTPDSLGSQLRGAFFGIRALRQLRGNNEIEVRVKLPEYERNDIYNLEDFVVRTPGGLEVPLMDVAEVEYNEAFSSINRRDGRRVVNVSTDVEPKREINQVLAAMQNTILPQLRVDFPGLTWTFEGSQAETRESTEALWGSFALAMIVIYSLLAIAFRSYLQPLIVLSAIPFGIIGAVIGHILLGFDVSLISIMGVVALSGVVVNDSLIMIDYANRQRRHESAFSAIHSAGLRRFRPILLTTLTTFGGLSPILFEKSVQAQYLIPMAISLGFGILFSTSIILLLVPSLYMILEDIKGLVGIKSKPETEYSA